MTIEYSHEEATKKSLEYFQGDELAGSVFVGKYALRNKQNTLLESNPDQMHWRLANEFARIENKYPNPLSANEIYVYLKNFSKIIPQGSPMAGIGNPYQYLSLSNCFVAGTEVFTTNRGSVPVEEIRVGDYTVTHKGNVKRVVQTHKNALNGRTVYDLKCFRTPAFGVTDNHQFMSISQEQLRWGQKPQFNPVSYLRVGDYIQIPNNIQATPKPLAFDLGSLFDDTFEYGDKSYDVVREHDSFRFVTNSINGSKVVHKQWIPNLIKVDDDFAYFIGLWYGDGCVFGENTKGRGHRNRLSDKTSSSVRGITFTFGSHETKLIEFVTNYLVSTLKLAPVVNTNIVDNTTQIVVHSPALGYSFEQLFGRRFDGKKLHDSMYSWPKTLVSKLMAGLVDSDGTITQSGDVRVVLTNKTLVKGFYHLVRSKGILVGYSEADKTARLDFGRNAILRNSSNKTYSDNRVSDDQLGNFTTQSLIIDGETFVKITHKQPSAATPEWVYTIGVEDDHSYAIEGLVSLNCFVLPGPLDSYGGICLTDQQEVQLMKRRGGVGFGISNIRPKNMATSNAAQTTDGIAGYMERYSNTCREVGQGGRRGALLLALMVAHPEILTFINIKRDRKKVTGANISVQFSDAFMQAVEEKGVYEQRFPVDTSAPTITSTLVEASKIWDSFIDAAWESAEPGALFWDTVTRMSPADIYRDFGFGSIATNPCGEIVLSAYDSCRLLLVNLAGFVSNPFAVNCSFDWEDYKKTVVVAQRLMDDVVDLELECIDRILAKIASDPEPENVKLVETELWQSVRKACETGRRTGTGITALGDTIAMLGVRYGSEESVELTEKFYKELAKSTYESSIVMASERGSFPICDVKLEAGHPFIERILAELPEDIKTMYYKHGRRNIANTTTAPAGSVSLLAQLQPGRFQTTSGIEPAFLVEHTRRKKINQNDTQARVDFVDEMGDRWTEFTIYHPGYKLWKDVTGGTKVEDSPYFHATSNDVDWRMGVKIQAAAQKWICHSISKTCNLPADATKELVAEVYMEAWKAGCKGFTIYRDGCRTGVLVTKEEPKLKIEQHSAPKRPEELPCEIHHATIQGEKWTIFIGMLNGQPYEVLGGLAKYISIPKRVKTGKIVKCSAGKNTKARYDLHYDFEQEDSTVIHDIGSVFENPVHGAFTRTISLALRHGTPVQFVVEQLQKDDDKDSDLFSFNKVISRVLKKYIVDGTKPSTKKCSECGGENMAYKDGCPICLDCGYSKCG